MALVGTFAFNIDGLKIHLVLNIPTQQSVSTILIALSVCAFVRLSRSRFWVSGFRRTNGQDLSVYFKWRCPGLIPRFFFLLLFFLPFSGGLPRVNTRVFFFFFSFFSSALFQRVRCVWQNQPLYISNGAAQG
jgi:hypothetical protein